MLQNLLPPLTAVFHLIDHNMLQPPDLPDFISMRNLYQKLLMLLTLIKYIGTMINWLGWSTKLCSKSVVKTLSMIFKNFIDTGTFPNILKRMISYYCNNNMNKHNTCSLGISFNKIAHWIIINSYPTIFWFYLCAFFVFLAFLNDIVRKVCNLSWLLLSSLF